MFVNEIWPLLTDDFARFMVITAVFEFVYKMPMSIKDKYRMTSRWRIRIILTEFLSGEHGTDILTSKASKTESCFGPRKWFSPENSPIFFGSDRVGLKYFSDRVGSDQNNLNEKHCYKIWPTRPDPKNNLIRPDPTRKIFFLTRPDRSRTLLKNILFIEINIWKRNYNIENKLEYKHTN